MIAGAINKAPLLRQCQGVDKNALAYLAEDCTTKMLIKLLISGLQQEEQTSG
jgi:hypothetical protein